MSNPIHQIKVVIIDDEQAARNIIALLLDNLPWNLQIVSRAANLKEGVKAIKTYEPDIVFLDIQMPQVSGIRIVDFFDQINFQIIFVTAYDNFAIKAFEINAIDYILKPIKRKRLHQAVERAVQQIELQQQQNYHKLAQSFVQTKRKLLLTDLNGKHLIAYEQIIALEARGSYCIIHLNDEAPRLASRNLKHYIEQIGESANFFRTHKAWCINIDYVVSLLADSREVLLKKGIKAKLAKANQKAFKLRLTAFNA